MEPLDVRELLANPGTSKPVDLGPTFDDLETELVRVPDDAPVRLDLLLESIVEGIYVTGPISGRWTMKCARCLDPIDQEFRFEVAEIYARDPEEEGDYALSGEELDLEPMIRDAIVLEMPFSPLCRPDCAGLCERCGGNRNLGECSCGPRVDPRLAVLSELDLGD